MSATDTAAETTTDTAAVPARRRWRFGAGPLVFMLIVGLVAGFAMGSMAMRPTHPGDDSAEAGYARDMQPHHAQAVDMSMIAYEHAVTDSVRQLAYDIALSQQTEIGRMRQWLREWDLLPTGSQPQMAWMPRGSDMIAADGLMPGMATEEQMEELRQAEGLDVDRLFLDLMIVHHLGGLHMIDDILAVTDHPEVTWLAQKQKDVHHLELEVLRNLRDNLPEELDEAQH